MDAKVIKTPLATTRYCWLQGEGYRFNDGDEPVFKATLDFHGADAQFVKREIDNGVVEFVDGAYGTEYGTGDALKYPAYEYDANTDTLSLKTKVKINGKKKDGTTFTRTLPVLDLTNKPVEDTVGSGSKVQMALKIFGWKGFGTVGLSVHPVAVLVHEANQGGASSGPRTKRSDDEWGDFFGAEEEATASPATAGTPAEEDDI